jgi:acyl-coenzyme A thioesterase PaaI-like protein
MARLSSIEVKQLLVTNLPPSDQHGEIVEAVGEGSIRMRLPFNPAYMGADIWQHTGTCVFSGPMTLGFAETAMFACIHGSPRASSRRRDHQPHRHVSAPRASR